MDELEVKETIRWLEENWSRRNFFTTQEPVLQKIFSTEALAFLNASCAADLPFPGMRRGMTFAQWVKWLEQEYHRNKTVMEKGVRAGAMLPVSPQVVAMWADDFLLGGRATTSRLRDKAGQGKSELSLKPTKEMK